MSAGKKRAAPEAPFMGTPAEIEECLKKVSHPCHATPRPAHAPSQPLREGLHHASPAIWHSTIPVECGEVGLGVRHGV